MATEDNKFILVMNISSNLLEHNVKREAPLRKGNDAKGSIQSYGFLGHDLELDPVTMTLQGHNVRWKGYYLKDFLDPFRCYLQHFF